MKKDLRYYCVIIFYVVIAVGDAAAQSNTSSASSQSANAIADSLIRRQFNNSVVDSAAVHDSSLYLAQNYPNPFKTTTTILFKVRNQDIFGKQITLEVFDKSGTKIVTLYDAVSDDALHTITFDGGGVVTGSYQYRLLCAGHQQVKLMSYMP